MIQQDSASSDAVRNFKNHELRFAMLVYCVAVPGLVAVSVVSGDRPIDTPFEVAMIVLGLPAIALIGIGFWKATVSVTADHVVVASLFTTRSVRREDVKAVVVCGDGEGTWCVLVTEHDFAFRQGQLSAPLLAGSQFRDLADLLAVPLLTECDYRRYLEEREHGEVDIAQFEAGPPAPFRVNWILRSFPAGLCYVIGVVALVCSLPVGMDEGVLTAVVLVLVGLALLGSGELLRRVLVPAP